MSELYVVGIGPGSYENMTVRAVDVLNGCDVIVGYHVYVDLVKEHFPGKEFLTTPMRQEVERVRLALSTAASGKTVAMICSGDAGVYGMSGLCEEMSVHYPGVKIITVPGVSAVLSGAAVLGAPLMHDFAVISLSDLMTRWEKIEKRLRMAAEGDFAIVLYNPSSRKRADYLQKACDILLETLSPDQICGTVRNIGRDGEETHIYTLAELRDVRVDMFTTVFIGNSSTKRIGSHMVTPRGYARERLAAEADAKA